MTQEGDRSSKWQHQQESFQSSRPQIEVIINENISSQAGDMQQRSNQVLGAPLSPDVIQFILQQRAKDPDGEIGRHQHT